ncbi:hypothetical protein K1719_043454 [Acacia pycnantha]|nr:hypothetical protein K1719_043454 [Acacia pycnantha]
MGKIHHVNIIRLIGFCAYGFQRVLVYEYFPNGSLQNFINSPDNKQNFVGWKKLHEIALGIAKGIEYLHQGCEQCILHFDIKPQNVLLDDDFTPKISNFGLAKLCSKDQSIVSITNARGTFGYIASEVFSHNFGREDIRIHIEKEGDATIARKLGIVGLWCIQWHAVDRPSIQVVVQMLEGEGDKLPIPPNPFNSNGPSTRERVNVRARNMMQGLEIIQEIE